MYEDLTFEYLLFSVFIKYFYFFIKLKAVVIFFLNNDNLVNVLVETTLITWKRLFCYQYHIKYI